MVLMIPIMVFLIMIILMLAVYYSLTAGHRQVSRRMDLYVEQRPANNGAAVPGQAGKRSTELTGWRAAVRWFSHYFESFQWSRRMEHKMIQAGIPLRGSEFITLCVGLVIIGAMLPFVLSGGKAFLAITGGITGYLLPVMLLRVKIARRAKAFNGQLGDALVLIANSLRTGYSFMQAMEMVAREMLPPVSEEFGRVLKEMNLGVATEQAMNNLAKRVDSDDLDLVVTAVLIQRQVGGNLAEVLDSIAGTIRERVKIKGQIRTLTAQGRISGLLISILPVALGVVLYAMNPGYITVLFTHPLGKMLLLAAVVSQLTGIFIVRKIVNIDV
ncbi:type ii secretion system (t2ss) protein f [Lucifera butyrica]|uniref:Type ii secretion system (T2ss) protein f n=1 Tax=Lucifera butyrica TaxID=1351585 RepID=A0A498R6U8_9FIRM|nr:type II secretion system F family protein [Lucifera butyrica]VBB06617.1 type ii secretion system (t2ss) protein f [Lucifera butyrica]